jgi:group II intron reverse transcriptase/maturase
METKLARIAEIAKEKPKEQFTSLYHLLNKEMLIECHAELDANKATGIDQVTKEEYERNLDENITSLVERLKRKGYRPQPVRRAFIPKDEKSMRPLGILAYEDKIVQQGLNKLLQAIYEQDFVDHSYGFRPGRSCHDALKELNRIIEKGKISYVVDADIKGFFTNVDHEWLMKFIELRIGDSNIKKLIVKFLKAGIMEKDIYEDTESGVAQGASISPVLANIYLHYALDLWFQMIVKKSCRGQAEIVRYADDFVCCFQLKEDAERFYRALINRLAKFSLEIAEEKTKILAFGRFSADNGKRQGLGKPGTFDFLGFTHYCSTSSKGKFRVKRKTSRKKFKAKVKAFKLWLRAERNSGTEEIMKAVRRKLIGHYTYYGITDNSRMMSTYRFQVSKLLFKWLNRRSQRRSFSFEKFNLFLKCNPLPVPKIYVNIYG